MKLVLVLAAVLLLALVTAQPRWRPLALGGAFLVRIGIPSVAFSGSSFAGLHIATLLVLAYALVWPSVARNADSNGQNRQPQIPILCHAIMVVVAAGTVIMSDSSSAAMYAATLTLNQLVAPYIFCMLIYKTSQHNASVHESAGKLFAAVCVIEALIAIAVLNKILSQPFEKWYAYNYWWSVIGDRQVATLDHPLCLGLLLAAGIPMVAYFDSALIAIFSFGTIIVGVGLTQSRISAAMAVIGIIYLCTYGAKSDSRRLGAIAIGIIGFATALNLGVFSSLSDRISNDHGSSLARTQSWQFFLDSWSDFGTVGVGMESSKDYFIQSGLRASGESAAVAYAVGIGIPLTLLYLGLMVWMIGYGLRKSNRLTPASVAAIVTFISIQLFSSISTESAVGMIMWATIGISLASPRTRSLSPVCVTDPDRTTAARRLDGNIPTAVWSPAGGRFSTQPEHTPVAYRRY